MPHPAQTKLFTPQQFLELAFALALVNETKKRTLAPGSVVLTVGSGGGMLAALAKAYLSFMEATGLDGHHLYYRVKGCDDAAMRSKLYNLNDKGIRVHYNPTLKPPVIDRVTVIMSTDHAEELLEASGYRQEIQQAVKDIPGFAPAA